MYSKLNDKKYKDSDPKIISWQKKDMGNETPLMYIYPQPGDNIKKINYFVVKDYEKALFYSKGKLMGVLGGGVYEIDKKAKIKGTEIVWIDNSVLEIQWGVPQSNGIPTKDGYIIGLHGTLKLKIIDVKLFYSEIVAGKKNWIVKDLRNWIISLLQTSMRDIFKSYEAKNVILEDRERVVNMIISKIIDEFISYGLELESLNILGIQNPAGMETLYRTEREKSELIDELELLKQKQELEAKKMELEAAKKAFEREQVELNAKAKLAEKKYAIEADKLEKRIETEFLEKEQKARDIAKNQVEGKKKNRDYKSNN
ncbi:MAG: SPFH domain-containing protein [Promethearchaeota archaeon]